MKKLKRYPVSYIILFLIITVNYYKNVRKTQLIASKTD